MDFLNQLSDNTVFTWVILPLLIFLSRICDVSIGTIRIIFVSRGRKFLAPLLGAFEVSIWIIAMNQIMQHLDNVVCFLAYAGGFAMGNYIGILIEEKLAMGTLILRIFLPKDEGGMKEKLYEAGYGLTRINAHGKNGDVEILFSVIKRKNLDKVVKIIEDCHSKAFYSIEEAKSVRQGVFPTDKRDKAARPTVRRRVRKGK